MRYLETNFIVFNSWPRNKLEKLCQMCTERRFVKDEVLFAEGIDADYMYIVKEGSFRAEKNVVIDHQNYWPITSQMWSSTTVKRKALYTVCIMTLGTSFGQQEMQK